MNWVQKETSQPRTLKTPEKGLETRPAKAPGALKVIQERILPVKP